MPSLENLIFYAAIANIAALFTYGSMFSYLMNIFRRAPAVQGADHAATGVAAFIYKLMTCPMCLGFWVGFITAYIEHGARTAFIVGAATSDIAYLLYWFFGLFESDGGFNLLRLRGKK